MILLFPAWNAPRVHSLISSACRIIICIQYAHASECFHTSSSSLLSESLKDGTKVCVSTPEGSVVVLLSSSAKSSKPSPISYPRSDQAPTMPIEVENSKGFTSILSSSRGERENKILYYLCLVHSHSLSFFTAPTDGHGTPAAMSSAFFAEQSKA